MDIKKFAPWNWFKKEDDNTTVPVQLPEKTNDNFYMHDPLGEFHNRIDRLFDGFFNEFGLSPLRSEKQRIEGIDGVILKPRLDVGATDSDYAVSVEIPGVSEKDISLELSEETLIIRGEKKQDKEHKDKNFYRLERSYGSFQRTLSLPEDADRENIKANFKNGVLGISIPRLSLPEKEARKIEIKYAS
jgi:HSP20 family protein